MAVEVKKLAERARQVLAGANHEFSPEIKVVWNGASVTICERQIYMAQSILSFGYIWPLHAAPFLIRFLFARPEGHVAQDGPVAQLVEQGTFNPKVIGSIPIRPT